MVVQTRVAPSAIDQAVTKDDVLRLIIGQEIKPLFLRPHLNADGHKWALVLGAIGDRGGGKSASTATIAAVDHMLSDELVFSNMEVKCDIEVDDETARKYGLNSGGIVRYESQPLIKDALLNLDERYRRACVLIEEINIQYSNVRRFMTNTNVDFNEVCQQLRKFETSLLFNVIDEMFIDPQLRSLSDIFIKTYDMAFDITGLENGFHRGIDFNWKIYPMSGYLAGEQRKYVITKKPIGPAIFHFANWHGIYNDKTHQQKGIYSISTKDKNKQFQAEITVESSPEIEEHLEDWGWLYQEISNMYQNGCREISQMELFDQLDLDPEKEEETDKYLIRNMRLKARSSGGKKIYIFPDRVFRDACV